DRTSLDAVVDAAHALAISHFLPHNHDGDAHEPRLVDGHVRLVEGVAAALEAHAQAGFPAMLADTGFGGMQLPYAVALACDGLFAVPRYRIDADGKPGASNDVRLAGINHKLGQRGIVDTGLAFGEAGDCRAELLGREGEGLAQMFQLMNEARLGVGMAAVMLAS